MTRVLADLTSEEVTELLWIEARTLGYSRDELDGMVKAGKLTPRQLLRKLEAKVRAANAKFEAEENERWHRKNREHSAIAFEQQQLLALADLQDLRRRQTLADRTFKLLVEAGFASETRAAALAERTTSGEPTRTVPRLDEKPLVDVVREILEVAIGRCEDEVDRQIRALPKRDLTTDILSASGLHPSLVAVRCGCSESLVRKERHLAGRQPLNGFPKRDSEK